MTFRVPVRAIRTVADLNQFKQSPTYKELMTFIRLCNDAVMGVRASSLQLDTLDAATDTVSRIVGMLRKMGSWVDDFPPIEEPMRFGNKAFRSWYQKLEQEAGGMVDTLLEGTGHEAAAVELVPYLLVSFGHPSRIDYGTGHETSFVVWLCCLFKLGSLTKDDLAPAILQVFHSYLQVMRRLQSVYMLEPAGSHGVWGLDDYHCLPFLWGSAQLIDHPSIKPHDVLDGNVLDEGKHDYLYLGAIDFIKSLKKGAAFGECCPMLNDISQLPSWKKVNTGMQRLYEGDVLGKMPVIQHFLFGSLLPCTWEPSPAPAVNPVAVNSFGGRAPWAKGAPAPPDVHTLGAAKATSANTQPSLEDTS
ncbi:unnamed protein product [Ectocarpus fasciculatus]